MSWETVAEALKDQVEAVTAMAGRVSIEDMKILSGGHVKAAVVDYGGFAQERRAFGGDHLVTWTALINLYVRWTTDLQVRDDLRDLRDAVLTRINRQPELGATAGVFDALIVSGESIPEQVVVGSVKFFGETLRCLVVDEVAVSYQE